MPAHPGFHVAEANVARAKASLDAPVMRGFVERLAAINRVADEAPGFVWRLATPAGDATGIRAFDDPRLLFNLSVWESVEDLAAYTYRGPHGVAFRMRRRWFLPRWKVDHVLWWIPYGERPAVEEALGRLALLQREGPGPRAFDLAHVHPPGPPD